jgi:nicotinamide-nucleotide amidase
VHTNSLHIRTRYDRSCRTNGGSDEKPVGTVYIALASAGSETVVRKLFFPTDRETFKQLAAQTALDLLRRKLLKH